jgi:Protein of unknown function (DUF3732)
VCDPEAVQLRALGLYSHDGELRPLRFRAGALNVISGLSRTGKTELLKIIDYCAGRKTPNLAPGPITRKVAYFAALFEAADGRRVLVVRPQLAGQSATTAMVAYGNDIDLPVDASAIEINATSETVRGGLDDLLGLGGYDIEEFAGVRERLRASVSHAIQFCLQAQTELMSPTHLFHRGGDDAVAEDFAELFPYFIGAVDERLVAARRRAAQLRRQLQDAQRRLDRLDARLEADQTRDRALVAEAVQHRLIGAEAVDGNPRELLMELMRSPAAGLDASGGAEQPSPPIAELRAELARARASVRELRERRAALGQLDRDRDDHAGAVETQLGRLGLVDHVHEDADAETGRCPACGAALDEADDTLNALAQDAATLNAQLRAMRSATRDIAPAERELDAAITAAQARYGDLRQRLDAALAGDSAARLFAEEAQLRARLLGVIEEYLRTATTSGTAARAELADRVRTVSDELAAVEPGTDRASIDEELEARLGAMSVNMTSWARELELEAADEGNVYIDRRTLNVAIGTGHGRIGLAQMGSGANHVGYHLVAHLALHQHFAREDRPVPRFVVFDQPSLPFFPQNIADLDAAVADVDWQAVRTMMRLADRVASGLCGALQIIMTDHATFAGEDWFDAALVEDWHTGTKLVPAGWPDG